MRVIHRLIVRNAIIAALAAAALPSTAAVAQAQGQAAAGRVELTTGRSTVLTTEKYLKRLDTTQIYRQAYETAGAAAALTEDTVAQREANAEFDDNADEVL